MTVQSILLPVFVYVAMVFVIAFAMGRARFAAGRRGDIRVRDIAVNEAAWPDTIRQIGNSFNNQFQLPVLFLALVILAYITKKADFLFVVLEWLFVLSRIVHAYIHCTSNVVVWRFRAYLVGMLILMLMWLIFAVRILATP